MKKKLIAMLLTLVLLFNLTAPVSAVEPNVADYIEVTSDTAILREGPGKSYAEIATLESGDCLNVTDFSINRYGNLWYQVKYGNSVAYLYEQHAVIHQHNYRSVAEGLNICKCGAYTIDQNSSMAQMGYIDTAGTLLTPDVVAAAAELATAIATVGEMAGTAIVSSPATPIAAIVVVAGGIIYMGVSASGTQVSDVRYIRSKEDVQKLLDSEYDPAAPYYQACTLDGEATLLMSHEGMDLNAAAKYLKSTVTNPAYATITTITEKPLASIWCFEDSDALLLAEKFAKFGNQYGYGSSSAYDCNLENDARKFEGKIYFTHYHLWYRPGFAYYMKKVDDAHIFFGFPTFSSKT